jgi:D-beta-D-heptose 7-phosphate kinase/D-beta-D-heptose 1-phosphate adenosyltransferase
VSTAGAGDTYLGALALALAADAPLPAAAELASAAAAVATNREGTAACTAGELLAAVSAGEKHLPDHATLTACVAAARREGRRVVFTNGCFDIIHRGHVTYLSRAKALGDLLVVGVNSDESVRRLKGRDRPINCLEDRLGVLTALSCVDYVISFEQETPDELIRLVRPDIFVKGGDYTRATLPEAPLVERLGGEVQILAFVEDQSTTGIIERIAASHGRRDRNGHHSVKAAQP